MKILFESQVGNIKVEYFTAAQEFRLKVGGKPLLTLDFERPVKESEERPIAEGLVKMYTQLVFIEAKEQRGKS